MIQEKRDTPLSSCSKQMYSDTVPKRFIQVMPLFEITINEHWQYLIAHGLHETSRAENREHEQVYQYALTK